jgi:hypothetical protein
MISCNEMKNHFKYHQKEWRNLGAGAGTGALKTAALAMKILETGAQMRKNVSASISMGLARLFQELCRVAQRID